MPDTNRAPLRSPLKGSPLKASKLTLEAPPPPSQRSSPGGAAPPVSHRTKTKKTKQKVQRSLHEASAARPSSPHSSTGGSPKGSPSSKGVAEEPDTDMSDEAAALLREACSFREAAPSTSRLPDEEDSKLEAMAEEAWESGWVDEAESLYRKLLGARRSNLGDRHEDTIVAMDALGAVLYMKSDVAGAQELLLEALRARRETLGNHHPDTVASLANSGMMLKEKGMLDDAEPLLVEALHSMRAFRDGGDADPKLLTELLICQANLGSLKKDRGQLAEAEQMLRESVTAMNEQLGPTEPPTLHSTAQLGLVLMAKGELEEAEATLREALANSRDALGDQHPQVLANISHLASLAKKKGDVEMSLSLHQQVLAGFAAIGHPMTHRSASHVISLLQETGRTDEAVAIADAYGCEMPDKVVPIPECG